MSFLGGLRAITASRATGALIRPAPTFSNVKLLLHAEGTPGTQIYTDSSDFSRSIPAATGVVLSTAQFYRGSSSISFSGAAGLVVPAPVADPREWLQLGEAGHPVTIECSIFFVAGTSRRFLFGTGEWGISLAPKGDGFSFHNNGLIDSTLTISSLPSGVFLSLAFQISTDFSTGGKKMFQVWVNGLYQGALVLDHACVSLLRPSNNDSSLKIGTDLVGYVDELRISEQLLYGPVNYSLAVGTFPDADGTITLSGGYGRGADRTVFLSSIVSQEGFGQPSVLSSGITLVSIFEGALGSPDVSVEASLSGVVSSEAVGSLSVADSSINLVGIASGEAVGSPTVDAPVVTAFRFWRLNLTQWATAGVVGSGSGTDVRVGDLAYFVGATEYPPTNMLDNVTPSPYVASVSDSSYGIAANCFNKDSSDAQRWISNASGGPHWITLDVGAPVEFTSFKISPDGAASSGYYPVDFNVTASNTGSFTGEEVTKFSATGITTGWVNNTLRTFIMNPPGSVTDPFVWNATTADPSSGSWTLTNGGMVGLESTSSIASIRTTLGKSTGKWYWEVLVEDPVGGGTIDAFIGFNEASTPTGTAHGGSATVRSNGSTSGWSSAPASFAFGDVICIALDADSGKAWMRKNGSAWSGGGDPSTGTSPGATFTTGLTYYPCASSDNNATNHRFTLNSVPLSLAFSAPSGFTPIGGPGTALAFSTIPLVDYSNINRTALTAFSTSNWSVLPLNTVVPTTGKWYVEFDTTTISGHQMFGATTSSSGVVGRFLGQSGSGVPELSLGDGSRLEGSVFTWVDSTDVPSSGTTSIGLSIDQTTGNLRWYSNGVLQPANASFTAGTAGIYFAVGSYFARGPITVKPAASATIPSGFTYLA